MSLFQHARRTIAITITSWIFLGSIAVQPANAQSQGMLGGFMELTNIEFGEGTRTFGPGQVITVSGAVPFIPWCPSMQIAQKGRGEGFLDFFPVADLYVIKDDGKPLGPLTELQDVSGTPNRVIGTAEGVFVEEVVGITQPAGNLGAGRYRVVMNQCLTGLYDPLGGDIALGNNGNLGFEVVLPGDLPPIQYSELKDRAKSYDLGLSGTTINLPLDQKVEIPGFCKLYGKLVDKAGLEEGSNLLSFAKLALDYCSDLAQHWQGIAADPPDPNYRQFAELGTIGYSFLPAATPLERAARNLADGIADQSAISQALLSSIEKFQGAQQAGDDEYTMLQLMQMNKFINLLIGPGGAALRSYSALESFDLALSQDPLGNLQEAKDLHAFIPEMRQAIGGLLDPLGSRFLQFNDSFGERHIAPFGLQAFITVYLGQDPFLPTLENLPGIPQVRAAHGLPPIVFQTPNANAGGPYEAPPGRSIAFDATRSTDPNGDTLTYAWDLDGDGNFNDGTGAQVQFSYAQPGTRLVAVKATDPAGNSNVAYSLVRIGDVNAQDIIAMPLSRELYRVAPDGTFSTLKPGLGFNFGGLHALHVDVNKDIWVLDDSSIQHYDSDGNLLNTITPQQVSQRSASVPLKRFQDFVLDGRGDLIALVLEDAGPGIEDIGGFFQLNSDHLDGRMKVFRIAKDGSRASFLADVNQWYLSRQVVNGQTVETIWASGGTGNDQSIALDPNGNIVVSTMNANDPQRRSSGVWTIDPDTGAMKEVVPAGPLNNAGYVTEDPYGAFSGVFLTFGGANIFNFIGGARTNSGGLEVDQQGNYIMGNGEDALEQLRLYRVPIPAQISPNPFEGGSLALEVFPAQLSTSGSVFLTFQDIAINSSGDYLVGGGDFSGQLGSGIFRVTPDSEVFKISDVVGPFSQVQILDVVPDERQVTPKDVVTAPSLQLSQFKISQDSCPGSAQFTVTLSNTGSADTLLPARLFFFDGEPDSGAPAIASVLTPGIVPAGASVTLQAAWASPSPGVHELYAATLGASPVGASFQLCISDEFASNPVLLAPASGTSNVGIAYQLTATVRDIFGQGVSGIPLTFTATGVNSATGTATTGSDGAANFSYAGTNAGQDSIVASTFGVTSNTVTDLWQGAINRPPVASAGPDQVVEATSPAGTVVNLSAAASSDPDGDTLAVTWTGPFGTLTGVSIAPTLPLGINQITATVDDGHGHSASATAQITVHDTTAPLVSPPLAITVAATEAGGARGSASALLAAFLVAGTAADAVDPAPAALPPQAGGSAADSNTLFPLNATTPVTFSFRDASGNVGSAASTVTVVLGQPRLYAQLVGKGTTTQGYYVDLRLTNNGTGNARNLSLNQVLFKTLSGTGAVTLNSPATPLLLGNLDVGASLVVRLFLTVPSTVTRFGITENGTVQNVVGANFSYSVAQSLYP